MKCYLGIILLVGLVQACNYHDTKSVDDPIKPPHPGEPPPGPTPPPTERRWFKKLCVEVLDVKCKRCHQPPRPKAKVDVTAYEALMSSQMIVPGKPEESVLYQLVENKEMPPPNNTLGIPPLTEEELKKVHDWILEGAPEN